MCDGGSSSAKVLQISTVPASSQHLTTPLCNPTIPESLPRGLASLFSQAELSRSLSLSLARCSPCQVARLLRSLQADRVTFSKGPQSLHCQRVFPGAGPS